MGLALQVLLSRGSKQTIVYHRVKFRQHVGVRDLDLGATEGIGVDGS